MTVVASSAADRPAQALAQRALALVMADPRRARATAQAALAAPDDPVGQAIAHRALGLATRELHDASGAQAALRRSVRVAERNGLREHAAEARMSLALVLDDRGRPAAALREIDLARADLAGLRLARATMQRAIILRRLGRDDEALAGYRAALASFRRHDDRLWQARARTNRGVLHAYRGTFQLAEADLRAAERLYTDLELPAALAQVRHNLGFVAAQAGDVPAALAWYDRADEYFRRNGSPAVALLDRAELLLAARLLPEARAVAERAVASAAGGRLGSLLAQSRLLLARVALVDGDPAAARQAARAARRAFIRQGRPTWAALARYVEVLAGARLRPPDRRTLLAVTSAARALADAGWLVPAWDARLDAAQLAVELGDLAEARARLADAAVAYRRGPARLRARGWHVQALVRLAAGDSTGARRAISAGLREIDGYRASLGAAELRIHGGAEATELAMAGLRMALVDQAPDQALRWLQRWRAAELRLPPTRPSADPATARDLAELRRISAELTAAPADRQRAHRLLRRQRALEEAVRHRTWRASGTGEAPPGAPRAGSAADRTPDGAAPQGGGPDGGPRHGTAPHGRVAHGRVSSAPAGRAAIEPALSVAELAAGLGERVLVELLALDGRLHALVLVDGRVHHRPLGQLAPIAAEVQALRFGLRRLVLRHGTTASLAAAGSAVDYGLRCLDQALLGPLADLLGDRPLVLAPTGPLHALPWPMLAGAAGRPLSVVPSATLWWRAARRPGPTGGVLLVAGPAPEQAAGEVADIGARLPGAQVLTGTRARAADVLAGLDGVGTGHLASHGEFRADNPLFSHLMLADGPLTVYDLSALRRPPALLVLSACDSGLSAVHPGDELVGLCAALLGLGTRTIVASTGPVRDDAARSLMVDFYGRLAAGSEPAVALAAAQLAAPKEHQASTHSFVCLGAG